MVAFCFNYFFRMEQFKEQIQMINEVTLEGIVTRELWNYDKDVFFRIAS